MRALFQIGAKESIAGAVADVENVDFVIVFEQIVNHSVNMGLPSIEQLSQPPVFRRKRAPRRKGFQ